MEIKWDGKKYEVEGIALSHRGDGTVICVVSLLDVDGEPLRKRGAVYEMDGR